MGKKGKNFLGGEYLSSGHPSQFTGLLTAFPCSVYLEEILGEQKMCTITISL